MFVTDLFFLRPWWLLALLPAIGLVIFVWRQIWAGDDKAWRKLVDPHLLTALTVKADGAQATRWQPLALALGLTAVIIGLAGPAWQKIDVPSYQAKTPTVAVLSLAQSMNGDDIKPSRAARAGHKLHDILDRMDGGDTGLVIYADRPFVASPLTGDARVIREMLPDLSTDLMPVLGNRLDLAITDATNLLQQAAAKGGRIIVLADDAGVDPVAAANAANRAHSAGYEVDAIGIGTAQGARLQTASGRAITSASGKPMTAGYDERALRALAQAGGGEFVELTADSRDLDRILPTKTVQDSVGPQRVADMETDTWSDMGYWLLFIPVLLAPLVFRRNVIMVLPVALAVGLATSAEHAEAADWSDLFRNPDQQAAVAFRSKDYAAAAETFEDTNWKASALYRNGDFAGAAQDFAAIENPDATYNRANALAKSGQFEQALDVYDKHLEDYPNDSDAQFNRDLVAKLLDQQKQENNHQDNQNQQHSGASQQQQSQDQPGQEGEGQQSGGGQKQSELSDSDTPQERQQAGSDQQDASGDQQDTGGQSGGDQHAQTPHEDETKSGEQQTASADKTDGGEQDAPPSEAPAGSDQQHSSQAAREGAFREAMNDALTSNGSPDHKFESKTADENRPATPALGEREQANEQLLRSVPDDASGLLRARIRQHYSRLRHSTGT